MKHMTFISILLLIIIISALPIILNINNTNIKTAEIYRENDLLYSIDLSAVTQPYAITIENGKHSNVIWVEKDKISMKSSNCPDKLCVKQGKISNSLMPIVCLPNNITIKIEDSDKHKVDAISR